MSRTVRPSYSPGLGWEPDVDEDDRLFPMELALEMAEPELDATALPQVVLYNTGPILNQGTTPMCVGYSWRQWLTTDPTANTAVDPEARTIYCEARNRDPWEGNCQTDLRSGTSTRAAAKYLQERGLIQTYVWTWDVNTIRTWILSGKGPVIVGTRWYRSMDKTVGGRIIVNTKSVPRGGHAYTITGYNDSTKLFRVTNSWGAGWGQKGHAWMRYADLSLLLSLQGECVTAVEIDRDAFTTEPSHDIVDIFEILEPSE